MFFIISGYGIYYSIKKLNDTNYYSYKICIEKRLQRLVPAYWLSLILILLIGDGAYYLSKKYILNIVSHFVFAHAIFPAFSGAIIGPAWFLGTVFSLYFLAPFLYKAMLRTNIGVFLIAACTISIFAKFLILHYVIPALGFDKSYNFWGARNLFISVLDTFSLGMGVAFVENRTKNVKEKNCISFICLFVSLAVLYMWGKWFLKDIWKDSLSGYLFHTGLGVICAVSVFFVSKIHIEMKSLLYEVIVRISKYEYEIYLLHLEIFRNVMAKSSAFNRLAAESKTLGVLALCAVVILFGSVLHKISANIKIKWKYTFEIFVLIRIVIIIISLGNAIYTKCFLS